MTDSGSVGQGTLDNNVFALRVGGLGQEGRPNHHPAGDLFKET